MKTNLFWKRLSAGEKGAMEDEMVGGHHCLNGHELGQTPGDSEGQGSLACCSPWGHKESDMTEQLNNNHHKQCKVLYRLPWPLVGRGPLPNWALRERVPDYWKTVSPWVPSILHETMQIVFQPPVDCNTWALLFNLFMFLHEKTTTINVCFCQYWKLQLLLTLHSLLLRTTLKSFHYISKLIFYLGPYLSKVLSELQSGKLKSKFSTLLLSLSSGLTISRSIPVGV